MSRRLLGAVAVVLIGAADLFVAPPPAAASTAGGCNTGMPFPCAFAEEWEAEQRCDWACPNWIFWQCGTTSITCFAVDN